MYKPILFNGDMVRAILDGRKTQTRRVIRPKFRENEAGYQVISNLCTGQFIRIEYYDEYEEVTRYMAPPCSPGDIMWVRETWHKDAGRYMYRANYSKDEKFYRNGQEVTLRWHPSIHMPKEAARIFLRVKSVHLERLRDARDSQCMAEGVTCSWNVDLRDAFAALWDSTIKPAERAAYGWNANPWVWVIEFERCEKPERWCEHD